MKQVRDTNGDTTAVWYHTQMHRQGMPGGNLPINPQKTRHQCPAMRVKNHSSFDLMQKPKYCQLNFLLENQCAYSLSRKFA